MKPKDANVPCGACTACCWQTDIHLLPEHGDRPADFEHRVPTVNPLTGVPGFKLAHSSDGSCVYLTAAGCSIYDKRPTICRVYDCRRMYLRLGNHADRKQAVRDGLVDKSVLRAARARLHTLTPEEIAEEKNVQTMGWIHQ
jgi:Fe-S-cluster containining protein